MFKPFVLFLTAAMTVSSFAATPEAPTTEQLALSYNFSRPDQKVADAMVAEAETDIKNKQPDAVLFMSQLKYSWTNAHHALPNEPYLACILYQFGGIKSIEHVQYSRFDEELNDTQERAFVFVGKFDDTDKVVAEKLKYWLKLYAASCDAHLMGRPAPEDISV